MSKRSLLVIKNDALKDFLSHPTPAPLVALPRTVVSSAFVKKPSLSNIFAHIRPDGLEYRSIPSLMGKTRKLITGEVVE